MHERNPTLSQLRQNRQAGSASSQPLAFAEQLEQSVAAAPARVAGWVAWVKERLPADASQDGQGPEGLAKAFYSNFRSQVLNSRPTRDQVLQEGARWVVDRVIDTHVLRGLRDSIQSRPSGQSVDDWIQNMQAKAENDMHAVAQVMREHHHNVHTLEFLTMPPNDPQAQMLALNNKMTPHPQESLHQEYTRPSDKLYRPYRSRADAVVLSILQTMHVALEDINRERARIAQAGPAWAPPKASAPSP